MNNQEKKIALVTGGSRGLGKDMALSLVKKGLGVIITYQSNEEAASHTLKEIENIGGHGASLQLDVAKSNTFKGFFDTLKSTLESEFGVSHFHYLINNAGIGIHAPFAETSEEQFDILSNTHLKGAYFLSQKALPLLENGGGIVNISTGLARFSLPGYAAYATMKGAVETLTKYQAKELGERQINVNVVAPGAIATDFGGGVVRDNDQVNQFIASQTALGRVGEANDIGGVVAFLCSDDAKWINGQRIEVSGGMFL